MKINMIRRSALAVVFCLLAAPSTALYARESSEAPKGTDGSGAVQSSEAPVPTLYSENQGVTSTDDKTGIRRGRGADDFAIGTTGTKLRGDGSADDNSADSGKGRKNDNKKNSTTSEVNNPDEWTSDRAREHRSAVANFVQNLQNLAENNKGGIGAQVSELAREQNESKNKVANAIDEIEARCKLKNVLIGTDYKNAGEIRSEIVKTENRIEKLNVILKKNITPIPNTSTPAEIAKLKIEQENLKKFILERENAFSLFGWFVKMFY